MHLASNIRFLRKRKRFTQSTLAESLGIKRSNVNNYENGTAIPPVQILVALSDLFHISVDTLLRINLSSLRESQLYTIENGSDVFVKGNELRVLTSTVDSQNRENIELVSIKAKAGYTTGYFDPEFISGLPVFQLPFLSAEKKYRTFQVSGDSMLPIPDKSWVTGEFVQDMGSIKDNGLYVVLTLNEGVVFKKLVNQLREKGSLLMISLNSEYAPYDLPLGEVREVWKFVHYISSEVPEPAEKEHLHHQLGFIKTELGQIKARIERIAPDDRNNQLQ